MKTAKPRYITARANAYKFVKYYQNSLKNSMTYSEAILWKRLKGRQLAWKFRRQHIIDKFIVDFVCIPKKLVIEVDGRIHDERKEYDKAREKIIESYGFKILRITNYDVNHRIGEVISRINSYLNPSP